MAISAPAKKPCPHTLAERRLAVTLTGYFPSGLPVLRLPAIHP
jgi:hypothetical protein